MKQSSSENRVIVGYIFRPWITRKDGTRDYAKDHGKKAFKIPVYDRKSH